MYLWLKRIFYGCDHNWSHVRVTNHKNDDGTTWKCTSTHRCSKCHKVKIEKV